MPDRIILSAPLVQTLATEVHVGEFHCDVDAGTIGAEVRSESNQRLAARNWGPENGGPAKITQLNAGILGGKTVGQVILQWFIDEGDFSGTLQQG